MSNEDLRKKYGLGSKTNEQIRQKYGLGNTPRTIAEREQQEFFNSVGNEVQSYATDWQKFWKNGGAIGTSDYSNLTISGAKLDQRLKDLQKEYAGNEQATNYFTQLSDALTGMRNQEYDLHKANNYKKLFDEFQGVASTLDSYSAKVNNGEWMSADDLAAYSAASKEYSRIGDQLFTEEYGYTPEEIQGYKDGRSASSNLADSAYGIYRGYANEEAYNLERDWNKEHGTVEARQKWNNDMLRKKERLGVNMQREIDEAMQRGQSEMVFSIMDKYGAEIEAIDAELGKYERGEENEYGLSYGNKTLDEYYGLMGNDDFYINSQRKSEAGNAPREDVLGVYNDLKAGRSGNADIWAAGTSNNWDSLGSDEVQLYYYIGNTKGWDKAGDFLNNIVRTLNKRATEKAKEEWQLAYDEANFLGKAWMNIKTVPANVLSGVIGTIENVASWAGGRDIDPYTSGQRGMHYSNTVRSATESDLNALTGDASFLGIKLGDVYQAAMSRADSVVATALFGGAGGSAVLGMGAAQNKAYDLYRKGASGNQILIGSLAAGAAEMAFEKIAFGKLQELNDVSGFGGWLKNMAAQGFNEFLEEAETEIANIVSDYFVMGNQSDLTAMLNANNGDWGDTGIALLKQVYEAGVGGFIGGFGAGGVQSAKSQIKTNAYNKAIGKEIIKIGGVETVKGMTAEVASSRRIDKLSNKVTDVDSRSNARNVGQLYGEITRSIAKKNANANAADVAKALQEGGISEKDASRLANAIIAQQNGTATDRQNDFVDKFAENDTVHKVMRDLVLNTESTVGERSKSIREFGDAVSFVKGINKALDKADMLIVTSKLKKGGIEADKVNAVAVALAAVHSGVATKEQKRLLKKFKGNEAVANANQYLQDAAEGKLTVDTYKAMLDRDGLIADSESAESTGTEAVSDGIDEEPSVSVDGKTFVESTGKVADSVSFQSIGADGVTLNVDGTDTKMDDVSFGSEKDYADADRISKVEAMTPEVANEIWNNPNREKERFVTEAVRAFRAGVRNDNRVLDRLDPDVISREDAKSLFKKGLEVATGKSNSEEAAVKAKATGKTGKKTGGVYYGYEGKTIDQKEGKLTRKQKVAVEFAKRMAERFGVNFYFYESYEDENGNLVFKDKDGNVRSAEKGFYDPSDGSIHVSLSAENTLFVISHELVHFIRDWSPVRFKQMADLVMEGFNRQNISAEELVLLKQNEYAENGIELTEEQAFEEVIAAALEDVIAGDRVQEFMMEAEGIDKSLGAKIKKFFQDICDLFKEILDVYKNVRSDSPEASVIHKMEDIYQKLQRALVIGVYEAGTNFQKAENTTGKGGVRYTIAGTVATSADIQSLAEAKKQLKNGTDPETIRKETGWFKGYDGEWRYEISDKDMEVDTHGRFHTNPDIRRYNELVNKVYFGEGTATNAEIQELQSLKQNLKGVNMEPDTLGKLVKHDALFFAYPQLKDIPVKFADISERGRYSPASKTITISNQLKTDKNQLAKTLVHEIQHAIQVIEGFTSGSSTEHWRNMGIPENKLAEYYEKTAGEIEARDVANRKELSAEGIKEKRPDIDRTDVVFAENSTVSKDFVGLTIDGNEVYATSQTVQSLSISDRIAKFKADFAKDFEGRTAKFIRNGHVYYAHFSKDSSTFGKLTYEGSAKSSRSSQSGYKAKIRMLADGTIFELVEDATYKNTAPEKGGKNVSHKAAKYWDYFIKTVIVDGKAYDVLISVRLDDSSGNWSTKERYAYSIRFRDNKTAATSVASPASSKVLHQSDVATAKDMVSKNQAIVNPKLATDSDGNQMAAENPDIRYSVGRKTDRAVQKMLETENQKLQEDVAKLKELLKLQSVETGGTKFLESSVLAAARYLKKNSGTSGNTKELAGMLNDFYEYIATNKELTWEDIREQAQPIANWIMDNVEHGTNEYFQEILDQMHGAEFRLTDEQMTEAVNAYGSYNDFRRALSGVVKVSKNSTGKLEAWWQEMSTLYPDMFAVDEIAANMPVALADLVNTLKNDNTSALEYAYNKRWIEQDLIRDIYDSYWRVSNLRTVADRYAAQRNKLISEHHQRIDNLKTKNREKMDQLKEEHWAEVEMIRKAYEQKSEKERKQLAEKYKESRAKAVESRNKTEMRHKVLKVVKELNSMLTADDKKRHVPDSLKKAVAGALDILNLDTTNTEERVAKYQKLIAEETDPDKIDAYQVTLDNIIRAGEKMGEKLSQLHTAYQEIKDSKDPDIQGGYDSAIDGAIKELAVTIGTTPINKLSIEQLEDVYNVFQGILTRVRDANKSLVESIKESISVRSSHVISEVKAAGGTHADRLAALDGVKRFGWNNLKPVYAFEEIGSQTLTEAFNNVRRGEDTWALDVTAARAYFLRLSKEYGYDNWDMDKVYTFEAIDGQKFELTLEQMMSLYAYSKRAQADEHLRLGGFVFDSNIEFKKGKVKDEKTGEVVKKTVLKYKKNTADAHQIDLDTMQKIVETVSGIEGVKDFVDGMQEYLSTTMGAKGNEVTMKMYGIKLFKEENYFPLKSAKQFLFEQNEVSGEVRIKNSGFTNKLVAGANNPIILSNFMDVWCQHVNDMSMYHAFTLPLEDFNRIFNYTTGKAEGMAPKSVKGTIQDAYSPAAVAYIKQLITDLNGGAVTDPREVTGQKLMGKWKKAKVMASLSVVIQQPTSIARAFAMIDPKYFVGKKTGMTEAESWEELKKYAPVAIIKEMGYFDTGMGLGVKDFIQQKEYEGFKEKAKGVVTDSNYRDEVLGKAPAKADEITWVAIWNAVKRETAGRHPELKPGTEEYLKAAGERFTEVITKTQVYDSVLARSANMRSKSVWMNMATAFMAEPTTTVNMAIDAIVKWNRGEKKLAVKILRAVMICNVINNMLSSLVYAMRDDDEEETFIEKYMQSLVSGLIDDMNPMTYFPWLKDVWSILQGYDVNRSDMSLISDAFNAGKGLIRAYDRDENLFRAWLELSGSVGNFLGVPVENMIREGYAFVNTWDTWTKDWGVRDTTWGSLGDAIGEALKNSAPVYGIFASDSKTDDLYDAVVSGDQKYLERFKGGYVDKDGNFDESKYNTALKQGLRDNDERIREAAEARIDGDYKRYNQLLTEIKNEGKFSHSTIRDAIFAEENDIRKDNGNGEKEKSKSETGYETSFTNDDYFSAVLAGDTESAKMIYKDLMDSKLSDGYLNHEAADSISTALATEIGNRYMDGEISRNQAIKLLTDNTDKGEAEVKKWDFEMKYGFSWSNRARRYRNGKISRKELENWVMDIEGADRDEARAYVDFLDLEIENPNVSITAADAESYFANAKPANIDIGTYLEFKDKVSGIKSDIDPKTGKAKSGSKKEKVLKYIHSLPLTVAQKDALYRSQDYAENDIKNAPWH